MIYHVPRYCAGCISCRVRDYCFNGGRRNVINHAPTTDALVFRTRRNVVNYASATGVCRLFYAILIPN